MSVGGNALPPSAIWEFVAVARESRKKNNNNIAHNNCLHAGSHLPLADFPFLIVIEVTASPARLPLYLYFNRFINLRLVWQFCQEWNVQLNNDMFICFSPQDKDLMHSDKLELTRVTIRPMMTSTSSLYL